MIVGFISMAAVILLALLRVPLGIALMSVSLAGLAYITSTTTALTLFPMTVSEAVLSYVGVGVGSTILPLLDVGLMVNQYRYSQVQYNPVNDEYELSDDKRDARSVSLTVEYRF